MVLWARVGEFQRTEDSLDFGGSGILKWPAKREISFENFSAEKRERTSRGLN